METHEEPQMTADAAQLVDRLRTMTRIRAFEERVGRHFRAGDIHGFVHTSIGQEAVAAGACAVLTRTDTLTTTHRGHGHCLAKGADPTEMMAELFGRATGACGGKGGSMHLAVADLGILGANGIVGAGIPIATGAGLASRARGDGSIAVAFFGEGAVHSGAFHEGVGLAAAWNLPVIFVCENNHYAEFTPSASAWGGTSVVQRAASYGIAAERVDGNDVEAVEATMAVAAERARERGGPTLIEAVTYRIAGHYEGDSTPYRPEEEVEQWRRRDPIRLLGARLATLRPGFDAAPLIEAAEAEMEAAVEQALATPYPPVSALMEHIGG